MGAIALGLCLTLGACGDTMGGKQFLVRARISSSSASNPIIEVNVEGRDGDVVDSALVTLLNPGNRAYVIDYLAAYGCYRLVSDERLSGDYRITVRSALSADPTILTVKHSILATAPVVSSLVDGSGSTSSSSLDPSTPISVAWDSLGSDVAYSVRVSSGTRALYQASSSSASCVIPANTLPVASRMSLSVTAIQQYGDPLLSSQNYYSVSTQDGEPYGFSTR
jgi:hypothetical protein